MQELLKEFFSKASKQAIEDFQELQAESLSGIFASEVNRSSMLEIIADWVNDQLTNTRMVASSTKAILINESRNFELEINWNQADDILAIIEGERV
jgi:hypothetical protein